MAAELVRKAVEYLTDHACASPADLATYVFGGASLAPLLSTLRDDRLLFDGRFWHLRPAADDIAILEVLTSGPNPHRHRIVEVAAARCGRSFSALVWSAKPLPRLLRKLGVPDQPDAPDAGNGWLTLEAVVEELRAFVGEATVAGFGCQPAFLDQLLGPGWPAIDLLRLLFASRDFTGRPDPARVAHSLGLSPPLSRRPDGLLPFSRALLDELRGDRSLPELLAAGKPVSQHLPAYRPPAEPGPGVYVMSSWEGEPLYVGKSVDVGRRVSSYLRTPIAHSRGLHHLIPLTARIEVIPVDDELEALVLESRLIEDWSPEFNIQRRQGARLRYLRLSNEPFPRLGACAKPLADGAAYFGPFRHATAAARLKALLDSLLQLRTCTRVLPPRAKPRPPCSKAAAGACLAPCVVGPPPVSYTAEVRLARDLLGATPGLFRRRIRALLAQRPPASEAEALRLKRLLKGLAAPRRSAQDDNVASAAW